MDATELITFANTLVDDTWDTDDGLLVLNQAYHEVLNLKQWEILKKEATGTMSVSVPYIALPSDFRELVWKVSRDGNDSQVIYVGTNYEPYDVVRFDDRRDYRSTSNASYLDMRLGRLVFTMQPTSAQAISYDYIYVPDDLIAGADSVIPRQYVKALAYRMAMIFYGVDETEKGRTYYAEYNREFEKILAEMEMWDATLKAQAL